MNKQFITGVTLCLLALAACSPKQKEATTLKDAFANQFYIGTALNADQINGIDTAALKVVKTHFNSVTAENCMKSEQLQPIEGQFDFTLADKFVDFAQQNNMHIVGHTLIWHSQAPQWFFTDLMGNDVSREVLIERMKTHITTVIGRYKNRIHAWDVVNEAILDDGSWRQSKFYQIIGEDFVKLAFEFAHQADSTAQLNYNDYSMANVGKREGVVKMVKNLQQQGIKIDGIGMQGHLDMKTPAIEEFEKSILAFSALGMNVMITELDLTVLPSPWENAGADVSLNTEYKQEMNPFTAGLPDSVATVQHNRYADFFKLFIKHQDKIGRVTLWGVNDLQSWRNGWPMQGRTDYALIFDRHNQPKPIVETIIKEACSTLCDASAKK